MGDGTRLTALESSFLAIEHPGLPIHVAGLMLVDGAEPVTMPELRRHVASRLRRLPRFRQRLHVSAGGLMRAEWSKVPRVNLDSHLFYHRLRAPGRRTQLFALCARIHESLLDRDRPLWEIHLIDGLEGGGQALLVKTHHAITDGLAGVELSEVLFDRAGATKARIELPPTRFVNGASASPFRALQALLGLAFTAAGGPLVLEGPFNGPVGAHRVFAAATLSMDAIFRAKQRLGGSVDDVVVAAVAAGLRRYLREIGYPQVPHALRAMLPVSTRTGGNGTGLGNHVTSVFVDLPMDDEELPELVRRIAASKANLRTAHAAEGVSMGIEVAGMLPNPLHDSVSRLASGLPFANLVLSDVPGLNETLFLLGRRIIASYPMMPLAPRVGLSIAALSMDGVMGVGVTADPGIVPNAGRLARAIEDVLPRFFEQPHGKPAPGGVQRAA